MTNRFIAFINPRKGADVEGTIEEIESNMILNRSTIWILVCGALLASIGLDTSSAAVIIGAMLISPLMGPILGVGLSIGLYDSDVFRQAMQQLLLATVVSLATSVIYFSLTPLGQPTPELMARTHPTLLDVLIAFFGGVAGIVSGSRREKSNAIPGVAIATALMPPLCTAGYGLATLNFSIFLGSFYLYCINATFIALSTTLIVRLMNFPLREYVHEARRRRMLWAMSAVLVVMVVPSVYFLVSVYHQTRDRQIVQNVVIKPLQREDTEVLKWDIQSNDSVQLVRVYLSGAPISAAQIKQIERKLREEHLDNYRVAVSRVNMSKQEIAQLSQESARKLLESMQLQAELREPASLQTLAIGGGAATGLPPAQQVLREVQSLFPAVKGLRMGRLNGITADSTNHADTLATVAITWALPTDTVGKAATTRRLYSFLCTRLRQDSLELTTAPPSRLPRVTPLLPVRPRLPKS